MSRLTYSTTLSRSIVGCATKYAEPSSPRSSAPHGANTIVRRGVLSRAAHRRSRASRRRPTRCRSRRGASCRGDRGARRPRRCPHRGRCPASVARMFAVAWPASSVKACSVGDRPSAFRRARSARGPPHRPRCPRRGRRAPGRRAPRPGPSDPRDRRVCRRRTGRRREQAEQPSTQQPAHRTRSNA